MSSNIKLNMAFVFAEEKANLVATKMDARQQLPRTAGTHEVGEAVVGAGYLVEGREADEDHSEGI